MRCTPFDEPEGLRGPAQTAVEIVVADTGCGIPPMKLESIFREFEQVESSEPKTGGDNGVGEFCCRVCFLVWLYEGSYSITPGLGLAVVARIVQQLGGQLRVKSEVEQGSQFSFLIPLTKSTESRPPIKRAQSGQSNGSLRVSTGTGGADSVNEIDSLVEALSSHHMSRPSSINSKEEDKAIEAPPRTQSPPKNVPGTFEVVDSAVPVRPVKIDVEIPSTPSAKAYAEKHASLHGIAQSRSDETVSAKTIRASSSESLGPVKLRVLIVEVSL